jgi:hypothetical protein
MLGGGGVSALETVNIPCPVPDCAALLKIRTDAQPGEYQCKCHAATLRYHVLKTTTPSGRVEIERWLQVIP